MKKIFLLTILTLLTTFKATPCGGDYGDYDPYYSLIFSQELINDSRYYPFLLTYSIDYYQADSAKLKNANIEEWQQYLRIPYEQAHYLVFKSSKEDLQKLLHNKTVSDKQLSFANAAFTSKYKDALQYLITAKELEPYMVISGHYDGWGYYGDDRNDIESLPYDIISLQLQKGWKQAKDKEIKLRYGYQLVRFAHYNRKYEEAIRLFDIYVEPLNHKSEMYYYALSQKAGAIRGIEDFMQAYKLFFEVFTYSADLKTSALSSLRLNDDVDYQRFQSIATTVDEKNDADLLLGYMAFSNPLASAKRIVARAPDAVQAKVLTARAISFVESDIKYYGDVSGYEDRRFPILDKSERGNFREILNFVTRQADSGAVKQKNYWNIASAYMLYLDRNFPAAQAYLEKVDVSEDGYKEQRDILAMLVDIGREERITSEVEERLIAEYRDIFTREHSRKGRTKASEFVIDMLSNRYYIQQDYAKSFMLCNSLRTLEDNPNRALLYAIKEEYEKPGKNTFEQFLLGFFRTGFYDEKLEAQITVPQYIDYMLAFTYLVEGEPHRAERLFESSGYSKENISSDIFGYNSIECFECDDNMRTDYLNEFSYIKPSMSELEIAHTIYQLQIEGNETDLKAAKANYLLGNFYYNVSVTGYYRNYLRFGYAGSYRQWFYNEEMKENMFEDQINLKYIPTYYDNSVELANAYLEKAYSLARGDEFKARIVFALSKCEQEMHYENLVRTSNLGSWSAWYNKDWVMISDRRYFKELMKYKKTRFFAEVETNCKYFEYYVSHL